MLLLLLRLLLRFVKYSLRIDLEVKLKLRVARFTGGDSHGGHWVPFLRARLQSRRAPLVVISKRS